MNSNDSNTAANAICHSVLMVQESWQAAAYDQSRPSVLFKPKLYRDGDQWCALLGDDLQSGVCGFGESPAKAMWDFDKSWNTDVATHPTPDNTELLRQALEALHYCFGATDHEDKSRRETIAKLKEALNVESD